MVNNGEKECQGRVVYMRLQRNLGMPCLKTEGDARAIMIVPASLNPILRGTRIASAKIADQSL